LFIATALLLPAMAPGLWLGNRLHGRLLRKQAIRIVDGLLVISGVSLLLPALLRQERHGLKTSDSPGPCSGYRRTPL
jgi:hypothetical protein